MKRSALMSMAMVAFGWTQASAADTRHNGGDLVTCRSESGAEFKGSFALDYLVGVSGTPEGRAALIQEPSSLSTYLLSKVPSAGRDLDEFMSDMWNQIHSQPIWSSKHVWRERRLGLNNLRDEELTSPLPDNCYEGTGPDRVVKLRQIVVREEMPATRSIVFNFSRPVFEEIEHDPMQNSFLMIHEWLWSHADNADVVRNLNWFLHSKEMLDMEPSAVIFRLASMGFKFRSPSHDGDTATIKVTFTGRNEPNGRPQFQVPEYVFVSGDLNKIVFVSTGAERFLVRKMDTFNVDLCTLRMECIVPHTAISSYPALLWVERDPLLDPIWDTKPVTLLQ